MHIFNTKYGKWLALIPILLTVGICIYFRLLIPNINSALLDEKFTEKQRAVDRIAEDVDEFIAADADWGVYNYERILSHSMASEDAQPFTFAALYNYELVNLSARHPSYTSAFEPLLYPAFRALATAEESGTFIMPFTPEGEPERNMHIYFRWVPTDPTLEHRYLLIVAISNYSVTNHVAAWVSTGGLAVVVLTSILNVIMVAIITKAGTFYDKRKGGKWLGGD